MWLVLHRALCARVSLARALRGFLGIRCDMVSVWVKQQADGSFKIIDQVTGKVYGTVKDEREVINYVRDKTGDMDVMYIDGQ